MLNRAIKQIEGCFSLPDLRDLWAENAEIWKALPRDQAEEIIRVKNRQKAEIEYALAERAAIQADGGQDIPYSRPVEVVMESSILGGAVDVELWPDRAEVGGVEYSDDELKDLLSRGLPADLRAAIKANDGFYVVTPLVEKRKKKIVGFERMPVIAWQISPKGDVVAVTPIEPVPDAVVELPGGCGLTMTPGQHFVDLLGAGGYFEEFYDVEMTDALMDRLEAGNLKSYF